MSKWFLYDSNGLFTGKSIDCPTDYLDQNVPEGHGCVIGPVDPLAQKIDLGTGLVVDYQPPPPSPDYQWDVSSKRWVYVMPLAEHKLRKNDEINSSREHANTDTFEYMGKLIRCRPLDRSDIDGTNGYVALFGTFPDGWAGGWKTADNSYVIISTIPEWKAFYKAMVDCGNARFRKAQELKAQLAAATTAEAVHAIVW